MRNEELKKSIKKAISIVLASERNSFFILHSRVFWFVMDIFICELYHKLFWLWRWKSKFVW